jgi:hypothetical protein
LANKLTLNKDKTEYMIIGFFLIPWTGGAFVPLGPFLCPTTEKKWPIAPKPGP